MLSKIDNISPGSEYSKASKPSGFAATIASAYVRSAGLHDTINFSPALQFLNLVRWRLKAFKHVTNDKLFLDFVLSDIEFQTTIDLVNIESQAFLDYFLIKEGQESNSSKKIFSDFSVNIGRINYEQEPILINLSALNIFCQRIFEQRINREVTANDKYIMNEFVRGITGGIKDEFNHLNNHLFIFLEKLENIRIDGKNKSDLDFPDAIKIKSIKIINA
jgi:hypothetical protein